MLFRSASEKKKLSELEKKLAKFEKLDPPAIEMLEGKLSPAARLALPADIQRILQIAINGRTPAQHEALVVAIRRGQASAQVASAILAGPPLATIGRINVAADRLKLGNEVSGIRRSLVEPVTAMVLEERKSPRESFVMLGGDFTRRGATVSASILVLVTLLWARGESGVVSVRAWGPLVGWALAAVEIGRAHV